MENLHNFLQKLLHGKRVMGYITDYTTEVDTEEDFEFLEWQINNNKKLVKTLFND